MPASDAAAQSQVKFQRSTHKQFQGRPDKVFTMIADKGFDAAQCRWPSKGLHPTGSGYELPGRRSAPPALHSRRGRDLWTLVRNRITAVVRLRAAMRDT